MVQFLSSLDQKTNQQENALLEQHYALQVLDGDQDAFAFFVHHYSSPLYNYIYRVLHNAEWAADVLQNVFLRFYTSLPRLNVEKPFKPWLFQVAHNCCIDELREQHRHVAEPFSAFEEEQQTVESILHIEDLSADIEMICGRHDLQSSLQRAIMVLPMKMREVVILRYTSNMTFGQIGQVLHMPEQTAKTYFCRARKVLRRELNSEGIYNAYN